MKFSLVVLVVLASNVDGDTCQHWTQQLVCNQEPPSNPIDPIIPLKRGKMGEKGEKGDSGDRGIDLSGEIGSLEEKTARLEEGNSVLFGSMARINQTVSTKIDLLQKEKDELNRTVLNQALKIQDLQNTIEQNKSETNKTIINQAMKIQDLQNIIEQNKDEMNNTIFSQAKTIKALENMLHNQVEQINQLTETLAVECQLPEIGDLSPDISRKIPHNNEVELSCLDSSCVSSGATKRTCKFGKIRTSFESDPFTCECTACSLPHIEHLSRHMPRLTPDRSSVELSCEGSLVPFGVTNRNCNSRQWSPDFASKPFSCRNLFKVTWDEANNFCKNLGTELITEGIDTTEKRKEVCKRFGVAEVDLNRAYIWTGITKSSGRWRQANGGSVGSFQFDWKNSAWNYNGWDFLAIECIEISPYFGKVLNQPKRGSYYVLCQN